MVKSFPDDVHSDHLHCVFVVFTIHTAVVYIVRSTVCVVELYSFVVHSRVLDRVDVGLPVNLLSFWFSMLPSLLFICFDFKFGQIVY